MAAIQFPKSTPAEKRERERRQLRDTHIQELDRRRDRIRQTGEAYVKTVSAGNIAGLIATLTYMGNAGGSLMGLVVLALFLSGALAGLILINCAGMSRMFAAQETSRLLSVGFEDMKRMLNESKPANSLHDAIAMLIHDLQDTEDPLVRRAAHGYLISATVSLIGLFGGSIIGCLSLYLQWLLSLV